MSLHILATGPLLTVQDLGRPGHASLGIGRSGAADRGSLRLANRLLGNPADAAALEVTFGGLSLSTDRGLFVVLTGAPCAMSIGAPHTVTYLPPGAELHLDPPATGMRSYLAVRGGIDVEPVLGSRATDTLSGIGPPPVRPGDSLAVATASEPMPGVQEAPVAPLPERLLLRVQPGPRADWFESLAPLFSGVYEVSADSDRVGMRLAGPALVRSNDAELPSEGMVLGALQIPPTSEPVLFLADHPVTGGYPVAGVVLSADVDLAAQARPGTRLRFRPSTAYKPSS